LKVMPQFLECNQHYIEQLMHLQVSHLGIMEDFIDIVHRSLDGPEHLPPWV
jgi:uncharacterized protein Usg